MKSIRRAFAMVLVAVIHCACASNRRLVFNGPKRLVVHPGRIRLGHAIGSAQRHDLRHAVCVRAEWRTDVVRRNDEPDRGVPVVRRSLRDDRPMVRDGAFQSR